MSDVTANIITTTITVPFLTESIEVTLQNTLPSSSSSGGGASSFLTLSDTPSSYVGQAAKVVRVNAGESGLEFATVSGTGDVVGPAGAVSNNFPSFNGATGKLIKDSGLNSASFDTSGAAAAVLASSLQKASNLSDLGNAATARSNLGVPAGSGNSTGTNTGDQTISDATISTTDITTNDVSTTKHGFAPKAPNDSSKFLDGTGTYSSPSAALPSGTASGTDTYLVTFSPVISSYNTNAIYTVKFTNANTGAATLNANSVGVKSIVKYGSAALVYGDIPAGGELILIYDGTNLVIANSAFPGWGRTRVILPTDQINNNATPDTIQDVTGLSFPVKANVRYYFKFFIYYTAAVATTGSRWSINGPSLTETFFILNKTLTVATTTIRFNNAYDGDIVNASSATTNFAVMEGSIQCSADGTVIARFSSEIGGSAITAKALHSFVEYNTLL